MPVLRAPETHTHDIPGARFTTLASPSRGSAETSVWRVELLPGAEAVPHRVTREEIFVALEGSAIATLAGVDQHVHAGDTLVLPPETEFALAPTGGEPFRALVCLPVGGQAVIAGSSPFTPPWAA
jgi:mannose-6-phosphate isomerase-like protein (cupin superfamily)